MSWIDQVLAESQAFRMRGMQEEAMELELKKQKAAFEEQQMKQSLMAQAIERAKGGWQVGGQPADVGTFGVEPEGFGVIPEALKKMIPPGMEGLHPTPIAISPGGPPVPFAQSKAQFQPPGAPGGMGGELVRKSMGLPAQSPQEKLQEKVFLEGLKSMMTRERAVDLAKLEAGLTKERELDVMKEREKLIRERPQKMRMVDELLRKKLEGKWTEAEQSTWDLLHPVDKIVMDAVEKRLKSNNDYLMGDNQTRDRLRAEEAIKIYSQMGRTAPQSVQEEAALEEPEEAEEKEGMLSSLAKHFLSILKGAAPGAE